MYYDRPLERRDKRRNTKGMVSQRLWLRGRLFENKTASGLKSCRGRGKDVWRTTAKKFNGLVTYNEYNVTIYNSKRDAISKQSFLTDERFCRYCVDSTTIFSYYEKLMIGALSGLCVSGLLHRKECNQLRSLGKVMPTSRLQIGRHLRTNCSN